MKKILTLIITFLLFNVNFASAKKIKVPSQLEIRQIQTYYYDTKDTNAVKKAIFATLQDSGFMITNIEDELGYITAYRDFKDKRTNKARVTGYSFLLSYYVASTAFAFGVNPYGYYGMFDATMKINNELQKKTVIILSNVVVEPYGTKTKVRVSFVEKVLVHADGYSYYRPAIRSARRIYSPKVYSDFFVQVAQSLYIADNKL